MFLTLNYSFHITVYVKGGGKVWIHKICEGSGRKVIDFPIGHNLITSKVNEKTQRQFLAYYLNSPCRCSTDEKAKGKIVVIEGLIKSIEKIRSSSTVWLKIKQSE